MPISWPILGNEARTTELARDLESGQLAHAYLLAGPPEVGKTTAAVHFANLILCPDRACGVCQVCRQIRTNTLPELTTVGALWIDGKQEDWTELARSSSWNQAHRAKTPKAKTDTIGIDDLREILSRIHDRHAGYQIYLLRQVERLTMPAVNSFLKILEEPPARTIFLLTTDHPALLPETLVSRCRVLSFGNVSSAVIESELAKKHPNLTPEDRKRIGTLATGKPLRAERLAANPEILTAYTEYFRRIKSLFEKPDLLARLRFAEEVSASTPAVEQFFETLTYFLRSFLLTRARSPEVPSTTRYDTAKLAQLLHATARARELVQRNANTRLVIENLVLEF